MKISETERAARAAQWLQTPWRERLVKERAVQLERWDGTSRGHHVRQMMGYAKRWESCLVAEQHLKHPEVVVLLPGLSLPADGKLRRLGREFTEALMRWQVGEALKIVDQVEDRVQELKREKSSADSGSDR